MRRRLTTHLALAVAAIFLLGGCENLASIFKSGGSYDSNATIEPTPAQLSELERLSTGSEQEKIVLFANIEAARIDNASDTNRLRYALAMSVLGHPGTDLAAALSELDALLGADNSLSISQTQLATVVHDHLAYIMTLDTANSDLRSNLSELESSRSAQNSRTEERLQVAQRRLVETEQNNKRLQAELDEARRQLDAILSIETSSDRN